MSEPTFDKVPSMLQSVANNQEKLHQQITEFGKKISELNNPQPKELLTIVETCELLGINRTTLWKWDKDGIVKSYGIEKRRYYKRTEIMEALVPLNRKKL